MTIQQAIEIVDKAEVNTYPTTAKIAWLSKLDEKIWREVFLTHEGHECETFTGYTPETNQDTVLLVPTPDDEDIYINWLEAFIHKNNGEMGKYNQSVALFNYAYDEFKNFYNRTHMPIGKARKFDF
ncbi:MAG: hypothetical protein KBS59_01235 [Clostridiales bacterium]|nr:hypothetical protein [Clostridiales bacterium]